MGLAVFYEEGMEAQEKVSQLQSCHRTVTLLLVQHGFPLTPAPRVCDVTDLRTGTALGGSSVPLPTSRPMIQRHPSSLSPACHQLPV